MEAKGWRGTLFLLAKSVTARELEQEGAGGLVWRDGRDWGVTIAEMRGAAGRQLGGACRSVADWLPGPGLGCL